MKDYRKIEDRELNPNSISVQRRNGASLHPALKAKIEKRIREGFYDSTEVIREIASRILKLCLTK
jgi:hypothetical protein